MDSFITTIVALIQLALAGFVVWGGWLCFKNWFRLDRPAASEPQEAAPAKVDSFERVASLVLLALLCTTLAAAA